VNMTHSGLPTLWVAVIWISMFILASRMFWMPERETPGLHRGATWQALLPSGLRWFAAQRWLLRTLKMCFVLAFALIIIAGLFGTTIPQRNLATVVTWNVWWAALIIAVFFVGSAWCAVCPWETLATWLVRRRWWRRATPDNSLGMHMPKALRTLWPALVMLIGLTWFELGAGVTTDPYATALLALTMLVMATVGIALFERRAFCRFVCPVGRTIGFYSQLAPVAIRPMDPMMCANCTTLECYHGDAVTEPCPTHLVMGTLTQSTYCTSCGNCVQSCPHHNVAWHVRELGIEAIRFAKPRWDEAWFSLALLALTTFHGLTMMSFWQDWMSALAQSIGDSGQLQISFTFAMVVALAAPIVAYAFAVACTRAIAGRALSFKRLFSMLAYVSLPLAFAYHVAHNVTHLVRESDGLMDVLRNPLGLDVGPLGMAELHERHVNTALSADVMAALQAVMLVGGFWLALRVIMHRTRRAQSDVSVDAAVLTRWASMPMTVFAASVTGLNAWLLAQPMVMRMGAG
jgi:polyferredoxin